MLSDLKFALRSLLKMPGFTVVAVLTLAIGIGAVTAVFSVLSSVLLHPPPYANAERLVVPFSTNSQRSLDISRIAPTDFWEWQREKVFERLAIVDTLGRSFDLSDEFGEPQQVRMVLVSGDYFDIVGIPKALLGRTFQSDDYRQAGNSPQPCMLSYGLWKRRYRGDPRIVGRSIRVDGAPCPVAGVLPQHALWPADSEILRPMSGAGIGAADAAPRPGAGYSGFMIFSGLARLKAGRSLEQTNAVLAALAKRAELAYPRERQGWSNRVVPLHEVIVGKQARTSLLISMAAVCCLLAIAVINVAGLLLSRAIARRREMQVRAALGAGRWALTRYLLAESMVLALPGGGLGLLLAVLALHFLNTLSFSGVLPLPHVRIDSGMFVVASSVALLTAAICGLAPLTQALRRELNLAGSRGGAGGTRLLNGLIVAEITLSVLLLAGAGLLIRSFMAIQRIDPGFQGERLLTFNVGIPAATQQGIAQTPQGEREQTLSVFRDLTARLEKAPGVLSAAVSSALPSGGGGEYFTAFFHAAGKAELPDEAKRFAMLPDAVTSRNDGQNVASTGAEHAAMMNVVSPGYFNTLGIRRISGRDFDSRDTADGQPVIVINEALARRVFPKQNPLGKRIRSSLGWDGYREVVGVVADVRFMGREDELRALTYVPYTQWPRRSMMLNVRTQGEPSAALSLIRDNIRKIHPTLSVTDAKIMTDILDRSVAPRRSATTLSAVLAGAAMLLAAIGLYGALSYTVAQRTKELGIRMALGARPGNLLGMIVGQGLRLTLTGVGLGLAGALLLTQLMAHLLYEVSATDPITFVSIAVLLTAVTLLACYLPARRAVKVDPILALRTE